MTTVPLTSKFLGELDRLTSDLIRVFHSKGGSTGKRIRDVMAEMDDVSIFFIVQPNTHMVCLTKPCGKAPLNGLEKDRHYQKYCVVDRL